MAFSKPGVLRIPLLTTRLRRYHEFYPVPEELVATAVDQRVGLRRAARTKLARPVDAGQAVDHQLRELREKRYRTEDEPLSASGLYAS